MSDELYAAYTQGFDEGLDSGFNLSIMAIDEMLKNPGAGLGQVMALKHLRGVLVGTREDLKNGSDQELEGDGA